MVTIHRTVTNPRMVTNLTDQTWALQFLFGYRTSLVQNRQSKTLRFRFLVDIVSLRGTTQWFPQSMMKEALLQKSYGGYVLCDTWHELGYKNVVFRICTVRCQIKRGINSFYWNMINVTLKRYVVCILSFFILASNILCVWSVYKATTLYWDPSLNIQLSLMEIYSR